jgi:hypothetical protein
MSAPVFLRSSIAAIQQKLEDASLSLLVSIESDADPLDDFWSDPLPLSTLNSRFLVVRLFATADADEISQFQELYPVPSVPCLLYVAPASEDLAQTWSPFPTIDEFYAFFISKLEMPAIGRRPVAVARRVKAALAFGRARFATEFAPNATVGELRAWARLQVPPDCRLVIAHTGAELPDDDGMTLACADLVPSVMIRAEAREQLTGENALPPIQTDVETAEVRPVEEELVIDRRPIGGGWLRKICGFLNPWVDIEEVEDFFMVKDEI